MAKPLVSLCRAHLGRAQFGCTRLGLGALCQRTAVGESILFERCVREARRRRARGPGPLEGLQLRKQRRTLSSKRTQFIVIVVVVELRRGYGRLRRG